MLPRRQFLTFTARHLAAGGGALLVARSAQALPRYTVSLAQLQEVVEQKFPRKLPVQGLLELAVQAPRLRLLPATHRLGALLGVEASSPLLRNSHAGTFDVEFALRYEASDRSLRAHQIQLGRMEFPTLRPEIAELLNAYAPKLADQALSEVTLHTLTARDTAVMDGLGMQPGAITVTPQGLQVELVGKRT